MRRSPRKKVLIDLQRGFGLCFQLESPRYLYLRSGIVEEGERGLGERFYIVWRYQSVGETGAQCFGCATSVKGGHRCAGGQGFGNGAAERFWFRGHVADHVRQKVEGGHIIALAEETHLVGEVQAGTFLFQLLQKLTLSLINI